MIRKMIFHCFFQEDNSFRTFILQEIKVFVGICGFYGYLDEKLRILVIYDHIYFLLATGEEDNL